MSNREIARRVMVNEKTVRNLRESICGNSADTNLNNQRKVKRGGKTYIQDTTNIGKGKSSEPQPAEDRELNTSNEEKEVTIPNEEENKHPSNTPIDNESADLRKLLSVGDRVRIKNNHYPAGKFGIVTFIRNPKCAVVEFASGKREVIELEDFDFSIKPQPQPPLKREIIIKEGLNYKVGNPGYGCKWYVEVSPETYQGLQEYQEKVGTLTMDCAIAQFLEEDQEETPNSDDLVLYFLNNVKQLPHERVNLVLEEFAKTHYDAFVQIAKVIEQKKTLEWCNR